MYSAVLVSAVAVLNGALEQGLLHSSPPFDSELAIGPRGPTVDLRHDAKGDLKARLDLSVRIEGKPPQFAANIDGVELHVLGSRPTGERTWSISLLAGEPSTKFDWPSGSPVVLSDRSGGWIEVVDWTLYTGGPGGQVSDSLGAEQRRATSRRIAWTLTIVGLLGAVVAPVAVYFRDRRRAPDMKELKAVLETMLEYMLRKHRDPNASQQSAQMSQLAFDIFRDVLLDDADPNALLAACSEPQRIMIDVKYKQWRHRWLALVNEINQKLRGLPRESAPSPAPGSAQSGSRAQA